VVLEEAETTAAIVGLDGACSSTASSRACLNGTFFSTLICYTFFSSFHFGQSLDAAA